jgi:hypothetical protein
MRTPFVVALVVAVVILGWLGWYFATRPAPAPYGNHVSTLGGGFKSPYSSVSIQVTSLQPQKGRLPIVNYEIDGVLPNPEDTTAEIYLDVTEGEITNGHVTKLGTIWGVEPQIVKTGSGSFDMSLLKGTDPRTGAPDAPMPGTYFLELTYGHKGYGLAGSGWLAQSATFKAEVGN